MGRAPCCSQVGLLRGPWTAKEDNLLTRYIEWHGEGDWSNLPEKAGLGRCGKSCRLRWLNYLRPTIKRGNISQDEEDLIIRLHRLLGNRWSLIAGRLPGRTDNEIKNHWNSHLSKQLRKRGIDPLTHKPLEPNPENIADHYTHENSKASSLQDGHAQIGQNQEKQARESSPTDHQNTATLLMQQPVHFPKANRYISLPSGANNNSDHSEGMDNHIEKSMQETVDNLSHILDESMGLHTPANPLGMSFKSDPWPESNCYDLVQKMQSPTFLGMELNESQHQYHSLPLIDDSNQFFHSYLQFCNVEGGSEFMIQNVFQDCSSFILECSSVHMSPEEFSLSDIKTTPNHKPSNLQEQSTDYEFQDVEWPSVEEQVEDILTL